MSVFYASTKNQSIQKYLKQSKLPIQESYHKSGFTENPNTQGQCYYGFTCIVSKKPRNDTQGQILDTIKFLEKYGHELKFLLENFQIKQWYLDLPYPSSSAPDEYNYLPSRLLKLAGRYHIKIDFSFHS